MVVSGGCKGREVRTYDLSSGMTKRLANQLTYERLEMSIGDATRETESEMAVKSLTWQGLGWHGDGDRAGGLIVLSRDDANRVRVVRTRAWGPPALSSAWRTPTLQNQATSTWNDQGCKVLNEIMNETRSTGTVPNNPRKQIRPPFEVDIFPSTMPPLVPSKLRGSKALKLRSRSWFRSHVNLRTNLGITLLAKVIWQVDIPGES
ncbi:hypothetical protein EDB85DRAFT_1887813 [Lactarius pseudohatsudake]|nr:hypothetical protein EDB85DRAFT_1887813 [Lactarius pseudohatsudake]